MAYKFHGMQRTLPLQPRSREAGGPAFEVILAVPFRNAGCPVLAFYARAGAMLPVRWLLSCLADCIAPMALITCTLSLARATGGRLFWARRAAV